VTLTVLETRMSYALLVSELEWQTLLDLKTMACQFLKKNSLMNLLLLMMIINPLEADVLKVHLYLLEVGKLEVMVDSLPQSLPTWVFC
jgi:hypothetical protein